jgi:hypothetical protein
MKTTKPKKLNRKQRRLRSRARKAAAITPPKPAVKKKKKPALAPGATARKSKAFATRPAGSKSPAVPLLELEAIPMRPRFVAPRHFFTGGGILKKLPNPLPDGWVRSTDERPGPEFRLAAIKVFRVADGDYVKLCRYMLRDEVVQAMRRHAERVRKEIAIDDGNAIARKELALLVAKNRRNGQPTRMFYK